MNETPRPSLLASIALAAVLAVGTIYVWSRVAEWEFAVESQLFAAPEPNESLVLTEDGQPLIQSSTYQRNNITVYRTLDGQQVDDLENYKLQSGGSWLPASRAPYFDRPSWRTRVTGFFEPGGVPHYWYLLSDGQTPEHGYFVGFDAKTKNVFGYLGSSGFRADPPPPDEQFEFQLGGYWGRYTGQYGSQGQEPVGYWPGVRPAIFLASRRSLVRVDLRHRMAKRVPLDADVLSVGSVTQLIRVPDDPETLAKERVVARQNDCLLVLDDAGQVLRTIGLPEDVRGRFLNVYLTIGPETIIEALPDLRHELTEVYWLKPDGDVARHEQLRLRGSMFRFTPQVSAWKTAIDFPSPVLCAVAFTLWVPQNYVKFGLFDDFNTALEASLAESWPTFLVVLAGSAVLGAVCYRRQRRYSRRGAIAWAVFVLLTGPAGFVGYLVHRGWPVTERCAACGSVTPRDRETCLVCATEFPRPAVKGIEIFA